MIPSNHDSPLQGQAGGDAGRKWDSWAQDQMTKARHEGREEGQVALDWVRQLQAATERLKARVGELESALQTEQGTVQVAPWSPAQQMYSSRQGSGSLGLGAPAAGRHGAPQGSRGRAGERAADRAGHGAGRWSCSGAHCRSQLPGWARLVAAALMKVSSIIAADCTGHCACRSMTRSALQLQQLRSLALSLSLPSPAAALTSQLTLAPPGRHGRVLCSRHRRSCAPSQRSARQLRSPFASWSRYVLLRRASHWPGAWLGFSTCIHGLPELSSFRVPVVSMSSLARPAISKVLG